MHIQVILVILNYWLKIIFFQLEKVHSWLHTTLRSEASACRDLSENLIKTFFIIFLDTFFSLWSKSEESFDFCNLSSPSLGKVFIIFPCSFPFDGSLRLLEIKKKKSFLQTTMRIFNLKKISNGIPWSAKYIFRRISIFLPFLFASFGLWCSPSECSLSPVNPATVMREDEMWINFQANLSFKIIQECFNYFYDDCCLLESTNARQRICRIWISEKK